MKYCLIILIFHVIHVENANILAFFPMAQPSHYPMFRKLLEELSKKGHVVDIIGGIAPKNQTLPNLNYIDVSDMKQPEIPNFTLDDLRKFTVNYAMKFMFSMTSPVICSDGFESESMKKLKNTPKKYDVLLIELFVCECFYGFAHKFQIPIISMISSTDLPWGGYRIGNPDNPSYIPVYFQGFQPHKSLYDRFFNTLALLQVKIAHWWYIKEQNQITKKFFGENTPDLDEIISNISLLLVNSHFSLNLARPTVPNFIEVGGLHLNDPKPLDKEFEDFIGNDKFIYFALGSIANSDTFEPQTLRNILEVFSEFPYKILWKANATQISKQANIPQNVLIQSWMPQIDILCHSNIVLFITHSGLMGTQEAINCGVPMLCLPLFADQYQNCQNMVERKIAKTLTIETFTKNEFRDTIRELIEDSRFSKNAKKLSMEFKDRPMSALETAIYWVEYVIRYKGAAQLKSRSIHLKWYQYYLFDVLCILSLILTFSSIGVYVVCKSIINYLKKKPECEIKKKT